jgi:hypothetical protein
LYPYAGDKILWYHSLFFQDQIVFPEVFTPHPFDEGSLHLPQTRSGSLWQAPFFSGREQSVKKPALHQWAVLGVPLSWTESEVLEGVKPMQGLLPREVDAPWQGLLDRWLLEMEGRLKLTQTMKEEAKAAARAFLIRGGKALPPVPPGAGSKAGNKILFGEIMELVNAY